MSRENGKRHTGDVKPRDDLSHVTQGRNYYEGSAHGYQLIYHYLSIRIRHRLGRGEEPERNVLQPWPQLVPSSNTLEPTNAADMCATGTCQFCGRVLISAVALQRRSAKRYTCGGCVKERGLTKAGLRG